MKIPFKGCLIMILLGEVTLILLCVVLQLHSILTKNLDFEAHSLLYFAAGKVVRLVGFTINQFVYV